MSARNRLQLYDSDATIKAEGLELTELEGALIAKTIIFQKIYQLPKSRWTALKDRLINVPINDEDILNTIQNMPRTPNEAGLIGVALKRKKEYKNTHKHQLIDPSKFFRMLNKLQQSGNKHYQFHDDFNAYQVRCRETDRSGYNVMFSTNDDVEETMDPMDTSSKEVCDEIMDRHDNNEKKVEEEYENNDPVKKYQFQYNRSLCMTDKYPEISVNENESISVAPGEGKVPKDILSVEEWDIKAFPHIHNSDGSNGKDQEREVRLTDQNYFIQRTCTKEKKVESPAYMYDAVAYLEK